MSTLQGQLEYLALTKNTKIESILEFYRVQKHSLKEGETNRTIQRKLYISCMNFLLEGNGYDFRLVFNGDVKYDLKSSIKQHGIPYRYNPHNYTHRDTVTEATHKIVFNSLYFNTILILEDTKVIEFSSKEYKDVIMTLIKSAYKLRKIAKAENKEHLSYLIKFLVNFTYGILGSAKFNVSVTNFNTIAEYSKPFFDKLVEEFPSSILKIYVDEIFILDLDTNEKLRKTLRQILCEMNIPYDIVKLN